MQNDVMRLPQNLDENKRRKKSPVLLDGVAFGPGGKKTGSV
jgi:hypothetical protein